MAAHDNDLHIDHLVDDYLHDLLPPEQSRRVEDHSFVCPRCAALLTEARRRLALLQCLPTVEPSSDLVPATLARINERRQRFTGIRRRLTLAMACSLAAGVLLSFGLQIFFSWLLTAGTVDIAVLGQRELLAASSASLRVRVANQRGGSVAMAGVPVILALRGADGSTTELSRFTTDDRGTGSPRFEVPDWADGTYQLVVTAKAPGGDQTVVQPVALKRSWKLMLSSDRPVYQPGQTILLRALALRRPDLKPVADQPAVFTLIDPKGNVLFKQQRPTSAFGITSANCELASEILEGSYTVSCKVGDTESRMALQIQRYVLPKFRLDLHTDRPYYQPGDTVRLTVQADYFFGKPVANGTMAIKLKTSEVAERDARMLEARTDDKGAAVFTFPVPAVARQGEETHDRQLQIEAMLVDTAGQKQSRAIERTITVRPIRIETIPEAGKLVPGLPNRIYLLVTRVDGTPVPNVAVRLARNGVSSDVKTDDRGVGSFTFTPDGLEAAWTMSVRDAGGAVLARQTQRLPVSTMADDFLVRTEQAVFKAGESMTLTALAGGVSPIFVDLIKDGQTLLSESIEVNGGKGETTIDLPAELSGTIEMLCYRFVGPTAALQRKRRVIYINPADELRILATLDAGEYRPGRKATLGLRLVDAAGKPTPGAISLAAVDEAVFSVLAQRPGMEQTFYNVDQDLLKPVIASYPWTPGERQGTRLRDQALFAKTARDLSDGRADPNPISVRESSRGFGAPVATPVSLIAPQDRHTLAARSLPIQQEQVRKSRDRVMRMIETGWLALIGMGLACGYTSLWLWLPRQWLISLHLAGVVLLVPIGLFLMTVVGSTAKSTFSMGGRMAPASDMAPAGMFRESERRNRPRTGTGIPEPLVDAKEGGDATPRLRTHFPETLLWKPELITDEQGRLQPLAIDLADSITTWRLSASAVASDGRLGATQLPVKVFQPFFVDLNLPVSLTRGDQVGMPVVVYNYLDRPQTVTLTLTEAPWFSLTGPAVLKLELGPNEVRSVRYTLTVKQVGQQKLRVQALAGPVGDALEREIEVVPDGRRVESTQSGGLDGSVNHTLEVPADVVEGSVKAFVKLYPSSFSQLVEGLDNIFRMPSGCFEQTSSTTYPNVLALDYLKRNNLSAKQVEAKARQYIHLGYQRLVGFEVQGGGFDWYGRPPANILLTAYGLMEFVDMARVHEVDPKLIERTRAWLLSKRQPNGSWSPEGAALHFAGGGADADAARLAVTAYVAWAAFEPGAVNAGPTLDWILGHRPEEIKDPHTLALVCNALLAMDPNSKEVPPYLDRLATLRKSDESGKLTWWERQSEQRTLFYGGGMSGQIETTALATLAMIGSNRYPAIARTSLAWLVTKKDPNGTWYSTQATVLALKALVSGSRRPMGEGERKIEWQLGDHREKLTIPPDQAEVLRLVELTKLLKPGRNELTLSQGGKSSIGYQVILRYHVPEKPAPVEKGPLAIAIDYDRRELKTGETVRAKATVANHQKETAPMVMVDLPIPPGFTMTPDTLEAMRKNEKIAKLQVGTRNVLLYLRQLEPAHPLELTYGLQATMPVKVTASGAKVYEYYDPAKEGKSPTTNFVVTARE